MVDRWETVTVKVWKVLQGERGSYEFEEEC